MTTAQALITIGVLAGLYGLLYLLYRQARRLGPDEQGRVLRAAVTAGFRQGILRNSYPFAHLRVYDNALAIGGIYRRFVSFDRIEMIRMRPQPIFGLRVKAYVMTYRNEAGKKYSLWFYYFGDKPEIENILAPLMADEMKPLA